MNTKHKDDDFDFPDKPVEPIALPPRVVAEDLKLGSATVKPLAKSWAEQHGPQPPGPGMRAMDFVIVGMFAGTLILFVKAWSWVLLS